MGQRIMIFLLLLWLAAVGAVAATPEVTPGEVARAQAFLKHRRLYDGEVNGRFDHRTAAALRRYQMMHRLRPSGRLDAKTEGRINVEKFFPSFLEEDRRFLETMQAPSPPPVGEKGP